MARAKPLPLDPATGLLRIVGVNVGLSTLATDSDGKKTARERYALRQKRRLARLQRALSRKKKGSANWKRQVRQVGKLHVRVANQRQAGIRTLAHDLVQSSAIVCLEDLNLKGLMQRPTWPVPSRMPPWANSKPESRHQAAKTAPAPGARMRPVHRQHPHLFDLFRQAQSKTRTG